MRMFGTFSAMRNISLVAEDCTLCDADIVHVALNLAAGCVYVLVAKPDLHLRAYAVASGPWQVGVRNIQKIHSLAPLRQYI